MPVVLCGIDEAGYGPMLGPLCVGASTIRIDDWSPGDPAPDLWKLLDRAVSRTPSRARRPRKIAIADSKALKLPNSSITRHPLFHLERGVLASLRCAGHAPLTDVELLSHLGAAIDPAPWYDGDPLAIPLGHSAGQCAIDANVLARAVADAGAAFTSLACEAVGEATFNDRVKGAGSKAAAELPAIGAHMRAAIGAAREDEPVRIVCDRLGGRTNYARDLEDLLQPEDLRVLEQTPERSRYALTVRGRDVRVHFMTEAERHHIPVALASMLAKYVREIAMARFNRYWCARLPELKPTAGYVTDARRWLADAADAISPIERAALVRIA